jgi:hypothetical protein
VALDESVDEGLVGGGVGLPPEMAHRTGAGSGLASRGGEPPAGVVALVLKPGRLGGLERCAALTQWARARGLGVVVRSPGRP